MIEKLRKQLERNWATSQKRFKSLAEPGPDYVLSLEARQAMKALLTEQEIGHYVAIAETHDSTFAAANALRLPWHFLEWLIQENSAKEEDPDEAEKQVGPLEPRTAFESVQQMLLSELLLRVNTAEKRDRLSVTELRDILKICQENLLMIAEADEGG